MFTEDRRRVGDALSSQGDRGGRELPDAAVYNGED